MGVRQQFTQKERDIETGLDYFRARYYGSIQGRFVGVDPLMKSASIADPQSFNRYSYVLNNPLILDDPDGRCPNGKKCYKDEKGYEYYNDQDGNAIYVTETSAPKLRVPSTILILTGVETQSPYEIIYRSSKVIRITPRAVSPPTRGFGFFGKLFGAIGIILFSPTTTGCGASPGMVSDGNGGCIKMTDEPDTSANPDPEDNKPDTSENETDAKNGKDAPDPGGDVRKLSRDEVKKLKDNGIDIHELKGGKGASRFDLYKDSHGNIFIKRKGGGGEADPTGLNIKDFP